MLESLLLLALALDGALSVEGDGRVRRGPVGVGPLVVGGLGPIFQFSHLYVLGSGPSVPPAAAAPLFALLFKGVPIG